MGNGGAGPASGSGGMTSATVLARDGAVVVDVGRQAKRTVRLDFAAGIDACLDVLNRFELDDSLRQRLAIGEDHLSFYGVRSPSRFGAAGQQQHGQGRQKESQCADSSWHNYPRGLAPCAAA